MVFSRCIGEGRNSLKLSNSVSGTSIFLGGEGGGGLKTKGYTSEDLW